MQALFHARKDRHLTELCIFGVMIALEVVLSRFMSFKSLDMKFSLSFVALVFIARSYGPVKAAFFGALCDFIGAMLFPFGTYFFGYTATAALRGLIWGLLLYKKQGFRYILAAVIVEQLICSALINSYWISMSINTPYHIILTKRMLTQVLPMMALEIFLLPILFRLSETQAAWMQKKKSA